MSVGAYACNKERAVLWCEYCDYRHLMELFGKEGLGNGGGNGMKQDISLLLWGQEPCAALVGATKAWQACA